MSPGLARLLLGGYSDALPAVGLHYLAAGTPVFEPLRGSIGQHGTSWRPSQEGAALVARHATRRVVALSASTMLAVLRSRTMSLDTLYVRREAGERGGEERERERERGRVPMLYSLLLEVLVVLCKCVRQM